jgi:hypothetical protein
MRSTHIAVLIMPTLIAAAHALAAGPTPKPAHRASHAATQCEAARLASWFERQRQLTDGDVDPTKVLPTPAECIRTDARAEESTDAHHTDAPARAPEESRG